MFYKGTESNFAWFLYTLDFPGMQLLSRLRETNFFFVLELYLQLLTILENYGNVTPSI